MSCFSPKKSTPAVKRRKVCVCIYHYITNLEFVNSNIPSAGMNRYTMRMKLFEMSRHSCRSMLCFSYIASCFGVLPFLPFYCIMETEVIV